MTTAEKLAEVTAQIRKDIPRTIELREGCYVKEKITNYLYKIYSVTDNCYNLYRVSDNDKWDVRKETYDKFKPFEIIGHDIMLNDVLEWLSKLNIIFDFRNDGEFWQIHRQDGYIKTIPKEFNMEGNPTEFETFPCKKDVPRLKFKWNLSSSYLKNQSEELIKFLYNLVKE